MTHFVTGFILRSRDFGEDDRLYTVYTREAGKQEYIAQGARKIKSKLAGTLETVHPLRFFIANGKRLSRIAGAASNRHCEEPDDEAISSGWDCFAPFGRSQRRIMAIRSVFGLVDALTKTGVREERLYELLLRFVESASTTDDSTSLKNLSDDFLWNLFPILGYRPEIDRCVSCHGSLASDAQIFDARAGGLICRSCAGKPHDAGTLVAWADRHEVNQAFLREHGGVEWRGYAVFEAYCQEAVVALQ